MTSEFSLPQSRGSDAEGINCLPPVNTRHTPCVWYVLLIQKVMICIFSVQCTSTGVAGAPHLWRLRPAYLPLGHPPPFEHSHFIMWLRPSYAMAAHLMDQMVAASTCPGQKFLPQLHTCSIQILLPTSSPFLSSLHFHLCSPTPSFKYLLLWNVMWVLPLGERK